MLRWLAHGAYQLCPSGFAGRSHLLRLRLGAHEVKNRRAPGLGARTSRVRSDYGLEHGVVAAF